MYAADAKLAELQGAQGITLAATWVEKANQEKQQADDIRHSTEDLVRETQTAARRATMFDAAEVFVEIAMVLCSVSLLASARMAQAPSGLIDAVIGHYRLNVAPRLLTIRIRRQLAVRPRQAADSGCADASAGELRDSESASLAAPGHRRGDHGRAPDGRDQDCFVTCT